MFSKVLLSSLALAGLLLMGYAGTPPAGEQVSAAGPAKCIHVTGRLLCGNADDQHFSNPNAPDSSTPGSNFNRSGTGNGTSR